MSKKPMTENETRSKLLRHARRIGAGEDLQNLFHKWDTAIALAPPSEKEDMSKMAILEVQALLDIHAEDGLTINDEIIIAPGGNDENN
jgi:hypothetical protein